MVIDKLSQAINAVGVIFWIMLVVLAVNIYVFATKRARAAKAIFTFLSVALIFAVGFQINNEFLVSRSISSFGITSLIYPEEQWSDFLSQFGYRYDGNILKDHRLREFADKIVTGNLQTDRAWIRQADLNDAIENRTYRIIALYPDTVMPEGIDYTATFFAHLQNYPENPIYFNLKVNEHNISRADNLLLYSDDARVTKALALIFAFRGYNVSYALPE